jgi:beta-lactamase superfamily II metal-dependent hydrolase
VILEIFDVEHGACALITTSNGKHVMIDAGHNATTGWRPGTHLRRRGIGMLAKQIITNYDEDHVSGYPDLADNVYIDVLARNPSVTPACIRALKSEDGMGVGIERLVKDIERTFIGGTPAAALEDFGDTHFTMFWNRYGALPGYFIDENNLSLVVFVRCGRHKFIFPGDMEKAGWRNLLTLGSFIAELAGVTHFVASHHGRENGYCEEVLDLCPNIHSVIISDKRCGYQSQETVPLYRAYARGFEYDGGQRRVLTTNRDGHIFFDVSAANGFAGVILGSAIAA